MIAKLEERLMAAFEQEAQHEEQKVVYELLYRLKHHHPLTYGDSLRVGLITRNIVAFRRILPPGPGLVSGLTHDIGKIEIPVEILDKAYGIGGNYTSKDREVMNRHPEIGFRILMERGLAMSAWVALTHHRRQPNPYPKKLPPYPQQLHSTTARRNAWFYSRVVSISDQYDAFHRENDMHGNQPLTSKQIKDKLIEGNSDQAYLINELYKHGILSE